MKLSKSLIKQTKSMKGPLLVVDLKLVRDNYRKIKKGMPNVEVFYAMKANDNAKILEVLHKEGCGFEISSLNEMRALQKIGVPAEKIMCFNSIKNEEFLKEMDKFGVEIMAFDSYDEVDKIAQFAPKSKLVLRLAVTNEGSDWPLTKKYGADATEALEMLMYVQKKGLEPIGITFHVGSQCLNKNNWGTALYVCEEIWSQAKKKGIELSFISLGGGLPVQHLKKIPSVKEVNEVIDNALKKNFKTKTNNLRVTIEPGRGLIGDTAIMVMTVVGKAKRGNEHWVYTDVGVFNGLMETIENFKYELKTERGGRKRLTTIAGPSCDSVDITFKDIHIPEVKIGDKIYVINAGAYTSVYAAPFNGFEVPKFIFINN